MPDLKIRNPAAEYQILGCLLRNGKDALIDCNAICDSTDFGSPINRVIFTSMKHLADDPQCQGFDPETIKLKAKSLGFDTFEDKKNQEYLSNLENINFNKDNLPVFALQIKKASLVRDMHQRYSDAKKYLEEVGGNETLSDIIKNTEGKIVDYTNEISGDGLESLSEDIEEYIQNKINSEVIDQVGLPTGFPIFDSCIGGGLRKASVNIIASRSGKGKSYIALNMAKNIAKLGIPVLYLDTELTKIATQMRMTCIEADCPINKFETNQFKDIPQLRSGVIEAGKRLKNTSFHYQSIAGMSHLEALAIARRWLVRNVGFNGQGKANDCLIIWDYFKLMSSEDIKGNLAETQLLGFLITDIHNFSVKYDVPFLAFSQTNRDGIQNIDSGTVAASDRLLWLSTSLSFLMDKTEEDKDLGCDFSYGNKKILVNKARYGAGMESETDYINIKSSLSPGIARSDATGSMTEGFLYSQIVQNGLA